MEEPTKKQSTVVAPESVASAKTTLKTLLDAFAAMAEEPPHTSEKQRLPGAVAVSSRTSSVASSARRIKKPATLLDAYEVDCIRRELESLILKHNAAGVTADKKEAAESDDAKCDHRHRRSHHLHHRSSSKTTSAARNANPAQVPPPTPAKKVPSGGGIRLLGRHAVAVCGVSVPVPVSVAAGGGRKRRRGGHHREVEKV